ncbi:uncharacterized protein LOC131669309 [Phymastichus coffea]|uniref:uncharacterized protein LOC131669309 n=1 Tax=Phymastichus coffea TaxID=108790 RepID=UPI00273C1DA5|nr:uncharacterized protein LOC131669309 [Phymastichus coffea]
MLKTKLQWWVETNNILPDFQTGFRKGQSTIDNLIGLTLEVEEAFSEGKEVLAAFLDIQGAFDNVNVEILLDKLAAVGCPLIFIKFIQHLTWDRIICSDILGENIRTVCKGVPQGGVLSPLLSCIYIASVCNHLPKSVKIANFANDIAFYCQRLPLSSSIRVIEKSVEVIYQNLEEIGLDLAPLKTDLLHFNKSRITPGETSIQIRNTTIYSSETVLFLGILFDHRLTFKHHINAVIQKAQRANNIIKYLCGVTWGYCPNTLLIFYESYIRSILEYGCYVYYPTTTTLSHAIEKVQFSSIRLALGYRMSTPNNILLSVSKLPFVEERVYFLCKNYINKVMCNTSLIAHKNILRIFKKVQHNQCKLKKSRRLLIKCIKNSDFTNSTIYTNSHYNIYLYNYDIPFNNIIIDTEFGPQISKLTDLNAQINNRLADGNAYAIFTDGSKTPDGISVGAATVCDRLNVSIMTKLDNRESVFTAECIAINEAVKIALNHTNQNVIIFTDSLSALLSLKTLNLIVNIQTNAYIFDIHKFQQKSLNNSSIQLIWIPAHSGIQGNESADRLAKEATLLAPDSDLKIPSPDLKMYLKNNARLNTLNIICEEGTIKGKILFQNFHNDKIKPWFHKLKLPRSAITTINRYRSGHYNLKASLYKIGLCQDTTCDCNSEVQDLDHILWQCPKYDKERNILIDNLKLSRMFLPSSSIVILSNINAKIARHLYSFFNDCKLII